MRILIAGASGTIGTALTKYARARGHEVRALVRREATSDAEFSWSPESGQIDAQAIVWSDAIVSLGGASVGKIPWSTKYQRTILESRLSTTGTLARAISNSEAPPEVWVSASAVGFYGSRQGEELTEDSLPGTGFLADVCARWESATAPAADHTRVVLARTGLVMGREGALKPLALATRFGAAARMGTGEQYWPWISLSDEVRAMLYLATNSTLHGPVNLASPSRATASEVTRAVARVLRRPHIFVAPAFVLRRLLGVAGDEMLLSDQNVRPERLLNDGFTFENTSLEATLRDVLR